MVGTSKLHGFLSLQRLGTGSCEVSVSCVLSRRELSSFLANPGERVGVGFVFFLAVGLGSQLSAWPTKVYSLYFLVAFNATVPVFS